MKAPTGAFNASPPSLETLWRLLGEGGVLLDDFDPEFEREPIEAMGLWPEETEARLDVAS